MLVYAFTHRLLTCITEYCSLFNNSLGRVGYEINLVIKRRGETLTSARYFVWFSFSVSESPTPSGPSRSQLVSVHITN